MPRIIAATGAASLALCLVSAALGQATEPTSPEAARQQVAELCRRAREAIDGGNYETAESLVSRAEALNVNYGVLQFLHDHPKKVRQELERRRGKASAQRPSARFSPTMANQSEPQRQEMSLPSTMAGDAAKSVANDPKTQARMYLQKARQEMARGSLSGATHFYQKAAETGAQFGPDEDSPAALLADLQKAGAKVPTTASVPSLNASSGPPADGLPSRSAFPSRSPFGKPDITAPPEQNDYVPGFVREQAPAATFVAPAAAKPVQAGLPGSPGATDAPISPRAQSDRLLLAARRALATGDVQLATERVVQAKALGVRYEFHEDNPTKVEAAIYKYNELSSRPAEERSAESFKRRTAELQMQQAEDLLRWNEFDEAERLVHEAMRFRLNYGPFEASPEAVLRRIADARKQQPAGTAGIELLPPVADAPTAPNATPSLSLAEKKARTLDLVKQAREALAAGNLDQASALAQQAQDLNVPDTSFGTHDDRPFLVMLQIQKQRRRTAPGAAPVGAAGVVPAQAVVPLGSAEASDSGAVPAVYDASNDPTRNVPAATQQAIASEPPPSAAPPGTTVPADGAGPPLSRGMQLFTEGEDALRRHDMKTALMLFREAQTFQSELDPVTRQRLQDHLQLAAQSSPAASAAPAGAARLEPLPPGASPPAEGALMKEAAAAEQVKYRQISADVARQETLAREVQATDPKKAKLALEEARALVQKSSLGSVPRDTLLRRIDRDEAELATYVETNKGKIELNERNDAVRKQVEHEHKHKVEVQEKLALKVDEFNKLVGEQRYDEAEVIAKQLQELAPREPVVTQIRLQAAMLRRMRKNQDVKNAKEEGFWASLHEVEVASIPPSSDNPITFPDAKKWENLKKTRLEMLKEQRGRRTQKEIEIEQKLKTPVSVRFKETALNEVLDNLAKLAQVNLHLDPRGLAEEGVSTDTPVTIDLSQEISLKSALVLILEPLHLSYVIKDEVLKITSEQLRDGEVITKTYNVADLVLPIPNFVPSGRMGLSGALADAHHNLGIGGTAGMQGPMAVVAGKDTATGAAVDSSVMAQFNVPNTGGMGMGMGMGMGNGVASGINQPIGFGPGGMGGGVQPDFDSLIELITGTIAPTTWSDVGGAGAIKQFATNLSLVISQTQEVHEEIADLLEQLRRLQDLQVTIEVRFITLSDLFYEQMGVQFDINANSNAATSVFGQPLQNQVQPTDAIGNLTDPLRNFENRNLRPDKAITVGLSAAPSASNPAPYTQDLAIPFSQNSFSTVQGLTGLPAAGLAGGGTLGFAILSELEAYFFMQAVQDDDRSNVMQAPKVTLFNGQQAYVSNTTQSPFVITVIPVVGDFAAAQQPVIVVLNQGTQLSVQAVVSPDRRFVRLTVVPFFSTIGNVNTFTFTGSSSSTSTSNSDGPSDSTTSRQNTTVSSAQGTTVQLPEFQFQTVTTTVSVPDGGTVLLGGIKSLSEERHEDGIPILNKLPYINRLFSNVATIRSTRSLLMMVTPRIIIQEEEEALLGVQPSQ